MKVKELIELLQDCNQDKEVRIDGKPIYSVEELFFVDDCVEIYADEEEQEEETSEDMSTFFQRMSDALDAEGEIFDMMKINRVQ